MYVAGGLAKYDGMTATKVEPYEEHVELKDSLNTAIDWLTEDDIDLVCLYTDEPDGIGHT